ncbi:site-specific DNA-methyltransferase [Bacillus luteolus]|uniref:Site-specific DNA-methyltransferase n=1 Tax=Litchfieldia luteola TaxID=682179 RepID=A0ABR9QNV1_9BACI|nr:site-specific DNA-methyltransferase [Cytobacillus luteolus]MBE4910183.1 site-specific DNA-methyltransferase [Cytobacillus luteolus]MBP1942248.1 adenine-specific DNA-methyltransferase [Cytobacillus luteolus]
MPIINFKGKAFVQNYHYGVKYHELIPENDKSITEKVSLHDNLIIKGDNLKALKALLPIYSGKVQVVVIDPPYNTGNEKWIYNDNVNSPMMQSWLGEVVNKDDLSRHDKWLCMMMPRLKLLRELMSKDGIIAITIDDHEVHNLGLLMDEIFGAENRVACAPWLSEPSGGKEKTGLRTGHEYIVIYHNGDPSCLTQEEVDVGELNLVDKFGPYQKGRELRKWGGTSLREDRPGQWFSITTPDGTEVYPIRNDGKEGHWRWGKNNPDMMAILEDYEHAHWEAMPYDDGVTYNGETKRWVPYAKIRELTKKIGWKTWLDDLGSNADGTRIIKDIFGEKIFDTPKPVKLYKWIVGLHSNPDAIVLDSFAGSGTTAHAVLELNKEDYGNRKFILVEMEEYANDITAERVRRIINGVETARDESVKNGFGGSFSLFSLGNAIEMELFLKGDRLPSYGDLARYVFYTSTGEEFDPEQVNESISYIGESTEYEVYLFYKPDMEYLKTTALTLEKARELKTYAGKKRLVFAPMKYLDQNHLHELNIEFCQLPFEIYKFKG